jgi:hypothetical protein
MNADQGFCAFGAYKTICVHLRLSAVCFVSVRVGVTAPPR